jgi:hypothetical protein
MRSTVIIVFGVVPFAVFGGVNGAFAQTTQKPVPPEIAERVAAEKVARRDCKIDLCKAFSGANTAGKISCDVTRTWSKDEIYGRIVGGSYVWGYGHAKCTFKLDLERAALAKGYAEPSAKIAFSAHTMTCDVDDVDPAKGKSFTTTMSITPTVTFDKGQATAVSLADVKTDGSTVASAAVTSIMAVDRVSGIVSRGAAKEINALFYTSCKEDGVPVAPKTN